MSFHQLLILKFKWHSLPWSFTLTYNGRLKTKVHLACMIGAKSRRNISYGQPGPNRVIRHHAWKSLLASLLAPGTRIWMTTAPNFKFSLSPVEMNTVFPCQAVHSCSASHCSVRAIWYHFTDARNTKHLSLGHHQLSHTELDSQQKPQLEGRTDRQRVSARCLKQQMSHNAVSLTEKILGNFLKKLFTVKTTLILLLSC